MTLATSSWGSVSRRKKAIEELWAWIRGRRERSVALRESMVLVVILVGPTEV